MPDIYTTTKGAQYPCICEDCKGHFASEDPEAKLCDNCKAFHDGR